MDKFNLEKLTLANNNYRKVINTTPNMQLVLMSLKPGVEIGSEIHPKTSQFIRVEGGKCVAEFGGKKYSLKDGDSIVIPPNTKHNIWCSKSSKEDAKLYTIYTPPEHKPGTIQIEKSIV
jgi:quercetin dioxygenase-like cupin family protein